MKNRLLLVLFAAALFVSCKKEEKKDFKASFTTAVADTLLQDVISIRALAIDGDKAWYAGSNGKYGWVSINGGKDFSGVIAKDTLLPEFRSLAQTNNGIFILSVGTPALLYKIAKDGKRNSLVYTESGEKVFYDCLKFYNDKDGIAMGDAQDGAISVITTNDGGETWAKLPAGKMPKAADGENAFAASNTNIVIKGDKTWIASGGKKSLIYYSEDKGKNWEVFDTPIVQGKEMTGVFGADFYDDKIGFAVGGDYDKPEQNYGNKILTEDGGKTWVLVGEKAGFGYASCVQFVPNSNGNELVTVGKTGVWYSFNRGTTWKKILDDKNLNTFVFKDNKTIIAAGQEKIIRVRLK